MIMKSTVKAGIKDSNLIIIMDVEIDKLRKAIWRSIFQNRPENMSDCDVAMSLGLVMYELIHHSDSKEFKKENE